MTPSRRGFLASLGVAALSAAGATAATGPADAGPVWQRTYGGAGDDQLQAVTSTPGGDVVLVGRTGSSNEDSIWLAAVTPDGTVEWEATYDAPGFPRAEAAVPTDGGVTLAGTYGSAGERVLLLHVGPAGEERWRREYEVEATPLDLVHTRDDGYLLAGFVGHPARIDTPIRAWTMRTGPEGRPGHKRTYGPGALAAVVETSDGFAAVGNALRDDSENDAQIVLLDSDARDTARRRIGGVGHDSFRAVLPFDPGFILAGGTESPTEGSRGLLVQTDATGWPIWRRTHDVEGFVAAVPADDGVALAGEPGSHTGRGRDPEKPLIFADSWGRVRHRSVATVSVGWPVDLARFGDGGYALAGTNRGGVWVARFG